MFIFMFVMAVYVFFCNVSVHIFCPVTGLFVVLLIYEFYNLIVVTYIDYIFFKFVACLLIFLMISFNKQKILNFVIAQIITFFLLVVSAFLSCIRSVCLSQNYQVILFSYKSFMVLGLMFRCIISSLILCREWWNSSFLFFQLNIQLWHHLIRLTICKTSLWIDLVLVFIFLVWSCGHS